MPRSTIVLLVLVLLLVGGAWFLASGVEKVPTTTIEEDVALNAA